MQHVKRGTGCRRSSGERNFSTTGLLKYQVVLFGLTTGGTSNYFINRTGSTNVNLFQE